jgi:hypothetical protein
MDGHGLDRSSGPEYNLIMAIDIEKIPTDYDEAVEILAAWHGSDPRRQDLHIYAFDDDQTKDDRDRIVRLLEVSPSHASLGEALPLGFGRGNDFPYLSEIVIIAPREWEKILAKEMPLPAGWFLDKSRQVWPQ